MSKTIVEITVPHLAESLVSAQIGKWLKKPGDMLEQYDVLCELFTEKVNTEMPSPVAGKIVKLLVEEGEIAAVGQAICLVDTAGENAGTGSSAQSAQQATNVSSHATTESVQVVNGNLIGASQDTSMRNRYSPAVQKMAAEHGINLQNMNGTGLGGRITRKDVEVFVSSGQVNQPKTESPFSSVDHSQQTTAQADLPEAPLRSTGIHLSENPRLPNIEIEGNEIGNRSEYFIDVTPIRNTIASRMRQSVSEIPHAWTMIETDLTNLVSLRSKVKDEFMRKEGINLTYLAFVIKAVVGAIKDYPIINSVWAVDKIIVKRDINISLAVGTEDFVVTPVIQKADQKNIAGLARDIDDLTKKARNSKLSLSDLQGGTFTVNNTGSFGSIASNPIINYPQAAILSFESIVKKPVVIQDMIAVRSMANLCLSLDHRILDGVICGRFLQRVKENLESYNSETSLY